MKLTPEQIKQFNRGFCPICGQTVFLHGPHGGDAENILCFSCKTEFWFGYPFDSEILDRHEPQFYHEAFYLIDKIYKSQKSMERMGFTQFKESWWRRLGNLFRKLKYKLQRCNYPLD